LRILILGGDGMLGHQLLKSLQVRHDVRCTLRLDLSAYAGTGLFSDANAYAGIDVRSLERIVEVLASYRPEVVVNCIGIVKQRPSARESIPSLEINALLPHRLALLCRAVGARLIHLSTDCVFSGAKGLYKESDLSDCYDLYGKSKFLGEVHDDNCLTLRTSIIGRELSRKKSLLEWFLAQGGPVKGFKHAIYSGFTTIEMSRVIESMLVNYPEAYGVYHVSSEPISKYDLLLLFKRYLNHHVEVIPECEFRCDRSLDSTIFRNSFDYNPPTWESMIEELSF